MTRLHVRLFGPFEVSIDGEPASGFDADKMARFCLILRFTLVIPDERKY
jgi:hypothetical protein